MNSNDSQQARGGLPDGKSAEQSLKVFINYRHEDTQFAATMLYHSLMEHFGKDNVFFDHTTLQPGTQFLREIASHAVGAGAFIALIGPQWMKLLSDHLRRGDEDVVAMEIDLALRSEPQMTIMPVLVGDTQPLDRNQLPAALMTIADYQAARLHGDHRALDDIGRLLARLDEIHVESPPPPPPRPLQKSSSSLSTPPNGNETSAETTGVSPPVQCPDKEHYRMIADYAGNLVVFLGSGANADGYNGQWKAGSGALPDDGELARYLAGHVRLNDAPPHLAKTAQYVGEVYGELELFRWVKEALGTSSEPSLVHTQLAQLPAKLGKRYQMIVTPKYDLALERAFRKENQAFDLAVYMVPDREQGKRGRFVHVPWGQQEQEIEVANNYHEFPILADFQLQRTVIVRNYGAVEDQSVGFPWPDNYVITEDHYIDFLSGSPAVEVVPTQILSKLWNSHYLFLGYSISDWRLRMFLQWIWKGKKKRTRFWAVVHQPDMLEKDMWQGDGVTLYECSLSTYMQGLFDYLDARPNHRDD